MTLAALIFSLLAMMLIGLMTGTFFTWSNAVMPGLNAVRPIEAIAAMRSMNAKILNRVFLAAFTMSGLTALVAAVLLLLDGETDASIAMFVATGVYLAGCFGVTGAVNVPMNKELDAARISDEEWAVMKLWTEFSSKWSRWNAIRGFACAVSLALTGLALYLA